MKQVKIFLLFFAGMLLTACGTDNDVKSESIFDTTAPSRTGFDLWLYNNYTKPYNIMFNYRYIDSETDQTYNLTLLQKLGYYNYQMLMWDYDGVTHRMPEEGSFFQTENRYQAFVYYKGTGARSWRLVGYQQIVLK